ncbi:L-fuculose-phosphate aldolase [Alkalispirochaeta americana]|uniref:L-fuculose-phosphate aldolase n=1 Tax=Alkalispirochaeta americana TaxID=159291 RepID=A0A1N6QEE3_9SPIO|nr:class II aldolase/adducin family protein [Alkalispirochaeta americana]SIQ14915.1 L-fuculose-phosphate aldolase [Alkalispirochaeta americana]
MARTDDTAREEIVYYSKKVHASGLVCATDGNLSYRLDQDRFLITPSGVRKEDVSGEMLLVMNMEGAVLEGEGRPSTEYKLHREVYRQRPDVTAVIHAHPPKAVAFTIAGKRLNTGLLPECVVALGNVPLAPYALPGTEELPRSMAELICLSDVVLLARHGSVTVGSSLGEAFKKLEKLEHCAQIQLYAELLGGPQPFSTREISDLEGLRGHYGISNRTMPFREV